MDTSDSSYVAEFKKGQIIGQCQSGTKCKGIVEISGIGLRTVQRIIKRWKDGGEDTSSRKMCGRKSILNERENCNTASQSCFFKFSSYCTPGNRFDSLIEECCKLNS